MKKKILGIIVLFGMTQWAFALDIEIKGRVMYADSHKAVEFANVVLQTPDSAFVSGAVTDTEGRFRLTKVASGDYRLVVSSIGYETQFVELNGAAKNIALDDILLEEATQSLGEVTVTASATTNRLDRKIIFPTERQVKQSSNGVDLLQQLMLPKLQVNPLNDNVTLPGGGEIQYRVNGVKVGIQEIVALQPASIIRVEYHDNPGLRYGNAEVVLDYIVRRPETGGNLGVNLSDALTTAWGNNYLNGRINHKKSEFTVNYSIRHRDFYEMWRDNEEKFTFADGSTLHRKETGEPGHAELTWQTLNTAYSYQNEKQAFNAAFRYYTSNQPHWDYKGSLYNVANPADAVRMIDQTKEKINRPALDLYYQQLLKNNQTLVFNLVGTYNYTDNNRFYRESLNDVFLTDVNNRVIGKKYSLIGEGIYEKKLGANRISAGLRHTQSHSDNEYDHAISEMNQSETFLYGEWTGK
ncbi:MAG: carboxypeptidase-like regulatory domain-containing protein, partial [Tannerella sp.]|nr:carboxypeptidase-like regulatory domain-containing protein [Tannerella sp.]